MSAEAREDQTGEGLAKEPEKLRLKQEREPERANSSNPGQGP